MLGINVPYYDNKYVQYRLMNQNWSTTVSDWQGVDNEPTAGSENLVESGGVFKFLKNLNGIYVSNKGNEYFEVDIPTSLANDYDDNGFVVGERVYFQMPIQYASTTINVRGRDAEHGAFTNIDVALNSSSIGYIDVPGNTYYFRFVVGSTNNFVLIFTKSLYERVSTLENTTKQLPSRVSFIENTLYNLYTSAPGDQYGDVDIPTNLASDYDNSELIVGNNVKIVMPIEFANTEIMWRARDVNHGVLTNRNVLLDESASATVQVENDAYYIRLRPGTDLTVGIIRDDSLVEDVDKLKDDCLNVKTLEDELNGIYTSAVGDQYGDVDVPTTLASDYDASGLISGEYARVKFPQNFANTEITYRGRTSDHSPYNQETVVLDSNAEGNIFISVEYYYVRFRPGENKSIKIISGTNIPLKIYNLEKQLYHSSSDAPQKMFQSSFDNAIVGERLNLNGFTSEFIGNLRSITNSQQGCAIYNGKLIQMGDSGTYRIYNLSTMEPLTDVLHLGSYNPDYNTNHAGSGTFLSKVKSGDEFPYLYVTNCFTPTCYVEKITESGSTLLQTITVSGLYVAEYLIGFACDEEHNLLYAITCYGESVPSNTNGLTIYSWSLPDVQSGDVTLYRSNATINYKIAPSAMQQGCVYYNNKLFILLGGCDNMTVGDRVWEDGIRRVIVYDVAYNTVTSIININTVNTNEPEGIAIYNGNLYIIFGNYSVYKLSF